MHVHVENITAQPIVYMRQVGPYGGAQNFQLMENMKQWIRNHKLWNETGTIYGIAQDNAAVTPSEKCRYDVCFVTETNFKDDTIKHGTLPPGAYLVVEVLHTTNDLPMRLQFGLQNKLINNCQLRRQEIVPGLIPGTFSFNLYFSSGHSWPEVTAYYLRKNGDTKLTEPFFNKSNLIPFQNWAAFINLPFFLCQYITDCSPKMLCFERVNI